MAEILGDNERRDLYRKMLNDAVTAESTRKYSLKGFEKRLLGDQELIGKISDLSIRRGWAIDENDFVNRYVPELKTATTPPAPKPQAAPVAPAPVEQFPVGITAPKPLAEPIPSVTDIGREMAFKPAIQQPAKPIGVMAPKPIEEPIPSVTETAREMAFKPPVQPKMPKEEEMSLGQKAGQTATELISGFNRALLKTPSSAVKTVSELGVGLLNMMGGNMESEDAILYSLADKYDKWLDTSETAKKFVGSPEYTGLATDVGSGLGQIVSMIAAGPQGASKALLSSPGVLKAVSQKMFSKPSLIAFSQVFNSEFENMKAKGESEQTAFNQGLANAMATAPLENLPLINLAERLNKTIGVQLARRVMNALQQGAEEGGQEAIQQIFSNLTNNQLVKSEENIVDWAQGVQPSAEAGGVVGLLIGGLANAKAARKYRKKPEAAPQAEAVTAPEPPVAPIAPQPPAITPITELAPAVEPAAQAEDELGFVDSEEIQLTPEERAALLAQEETAPVAPAIAPLNIDFTRNEGRNVNYQGIEGRVKIDSDGAPYVFTKDGDVVYIEGGLSGQTPQQLGVQPLADDVINEADVETVLQDENAPLDQNQLEYDFDNNTVTLYGKPFTYEGVETNSKGQTTALRLRDANGKVKFVRNEDTILEFEIQKELYEKSRTNKPATIESATAAAQQLQVVPVARIEQVPEPIQQEGPVGDIESDEVAPAEEVAPEAPAAPAPKGSKKAAPVTPAPAAPKKEEVQQEPRAAQKIAAISPTNLQVFKGVVTKDPLRTKLQGVYFDKANQKIVATDGMNMVVISRDVKSDVVINPKTGEVIKEPFPDYQTVIPTDYTKGVRNVSINDLLGKLDAIIKGDKERTEKALATITFDGEQMGITPKVLKAGLKALKDLGYETASIEYKAPNKPLLIKTKDGKTLLLTMPAFLGEDRAEGAISIGEFALEDIGKPKAEPAPETKEGKKAEAKKEETRIEQSKSRAKDSKDAQNHSADLSGEAYELEDGTGLVQGFNLMGKPVYSGYKKGKRTRVDIDSYTGDVFTAEELSALKELKKELEASEKAAQTQDPFKQQGRVAKTDSVPENVRKFVEDITKSLGIDKKIIIITDGDFNEGQYQKHGLYGTLAQVRSAKQSASNPYEYGAKRYMSDADAFYIYYDGKLKGDQLFTVISHELGHIVEQEVFNNSSEQTKKSVKEDYEKWLASLTGKTVEEVAKETRDITLADLIEGNTRKFDASKDRYISSFSEYFADNVSKWARTSAKPKSAVDKYFSGIVEAFKKLHDYVFEKGLYSKSLFDWLDGMYEAEPTTTPKFTSQQSSEAATAFDKAKTSKGFDKKHGKGVYKALSDITKNFEDIMDKVSDKIKQDCL